MKIYIQRSETWNEPASTMDDNRAANGLPYNVRTMVSLEAEGWIDGVRRVYISLVGWVNDVDDALRALGEVVEP